jgi:hypothetical protein
MNKARAILESLRKLAGQLDSCMSIGVVERLGTGCSVRTIALLEEMGITWYPNAKIYN